MSEEHRLARRAVEDGFLRPADLTEEAPPRAPDKYVLERRIGSGGAGVVWLARDRLLDRRVALKFLEESAPAVMERFWREARFTARLASRSIVRIYEFDQFEGRHFLAMEYVDGGNLAEARLDHQGLARVVREVADALEHAHEQGIVHRDIKPENVLLDRGGRAYLTDFGIARDLFGSAGVTLSHAGQIMGTPACMAPEQARGEPHAVDARSDVYSLGATLYFKLCGRWPFEGANVVDLLHAVIHDDPPMPRSLRQDVPRALEAIALRCLQKKKRDRYTSMRALVAELDGFLAGSEVASESRVWFSKLVHKLTGSPPAPVPEPDAERKDDPYWTLGMEVARDLAVWEADIYRVSRNVHEKLRQLERLVARLDAFLLERPDAAWARWFRGLTLFRLDRLDEALDEMEQAIDRIDLAGAHFELGRLYLAIHLREQRRARRHLSTSGTREHLRSLRGRLEQAVVALAEARRRDASLGEGQGCFADAVARLAEDDYDGCLAECEAILADDPDAEWVWCLRGDALRLAGRDPFPSWERVLEIRRSAYDVCLAMAEAHFQREDLRATRGALDRALTIHPEHVASLILAARVELAEGRADGSEETLARGLELAARARALAPRSYDARLAAAEIHMTRAGLEGSVGVDALDRALAELAHARNLEGCQNRVAFLTAQARLARARALLDRGEDPRPDLDAVLAHEQSDALRVPDAGPWVALLDEARALADAGRRD